METLGLALSAIELGSVSAFGRCAGVSGFGGLLVTWPLKKMQLYRLLVTIEHHVYFLLLYCKRCLGFLHI